MRNLVIEIHHPHKGKLCHLSSYKALFKFVDNWKRDCEEDVYADWVSVNGLVFLGWDEIYDAAAVGATTPC